MTCPIFDPVSFLLAYPEFDCLTSAQLTAISVQSTTLYSGFGGILEAQRTLALELAVAHLATLRFNKLFAGGALSSIKSRNDTIKYATSQSSEPFGLQSTTYGQMLARLFKRSAYTASFVSTGIGLPYGYLNEHEDCC